MKNPLHSTFVKNFVQEINKAKKGQDSSLEYITLPLSAIEDRSNFEYFCSIGGTNVIVSSKSEIIKKIKLKKLKTGRELITIITKIIPPIAQSLLVTIAFPFLPIVCGNYTSGIITKSVKEHRIDDILNHDFGKLLLDRIPTLKKIQVINDVHYLLYSNYISMGANASLILGTGLNCGMIENGNCINLECGGFDGFDPLPTTLIIDSQSSLPSHRLLEKEIAGSYLYQHYNLIKNATLNSTEELTLIDDEVSKLLWHNTKSKLNLVEKAIEEYMYPQIVTWSYQGSVIGYIHSKQPLLSKI